MKRGFEFSKVIIILTGLVFIGSLILGFIFNNRNTILDTSFYIATLTVSGGIWGTALLNYYKKSQAENVVKLRINVYKAIAKERLFFNEEMLKLRERYNVTELDLDKVEQYSDLDDLMLSATQELSTSADSAINDATEQIMIQNF